MTELFRICANLCSTYFAVCIHATAPSLYPHIFSRFWNIHIKVNFWWDFCVVRKGQKTVKKWVKVGQTHYFSKSISFTGVTSGECLSSVAAELHRFSHPFWFYLAQHMRTGRKVESRDGLEILSIRMTTTWAAHLKNWTATFHIWNLPLFCKHYGQRWRSAHKRIPLKGKSRIYTI